MKHYTVLSSNGKVARTGFCPEELIALQAGEGETVVEGTVEEAPSEPVYSWRGNRVREYPPLQNLADALYWAQKGNQAPMDAYLAACEEVKRKYPKE